MDGSIQEAAMDYTLQVQSEKKTLDRDHFVYLEICTRAIISFSTICGYFIGNILMRMWLERIKEIINGENR